MVSTHTTTAESHHIFNNNDNNFFLLSAAKRKTQEEEGPIDRCSDFALASFSLSRAIIALQKAILPNYFKYKNNIHEK
jgi:hypothetical protein